MEVSVSLSFPLPFVLSLSSWILLGPSFVVVIIALHFAEEMYGMRTDRLGRRVASTFSPSVRDRFKWKSQSGAPNKKEVDQRFARPLG